MSLLKYASDVLEKAGRVFDLRGNTLNLDYFLPELWRIQRLRSDNLPVELIMSPEFKPLFADGMIEYYKHTFGALLDLKPVQPSDPFYLCGFDKYHVPMGDGALVITARSSDCVTSQFSPFTGQCILCVSPEMDDPLKSIVLFNIGHRVPDSKTS